MTLRNFERRPAHTALALAGIALAVALLVTGLAMYDSVKYLADVQFQVAEGDDAQVAFTTPQPARVRNELASVPGVTRVELFRAVPVTLAARQRTRRAAITALEGRPDLRRIVDRTGRVVTPPPQGLTLSAELARRLGVGRGDVVMVTVLEGRHLTRNVPVVGIVDDLLGMNAYMEIGALQRLLEEAPMASGAFLDIDQSVAGEVFGRLERLPEVSQVMLRRAAIQSFENTIKQSMSVMIGVIIMFAGVIAFGIVYNTARIALSERGRELASLRVLGFSRGEVSRILFGEQAALTVIAIPVGFALGKALMVLLAKSSSTDLFRLPVVIQPTTYATAMLVVVGAALFSAALVRHRLDTLDLVSVLKARE